MKELVIPSEVARRLGYYVYLYVDPRNNKPFYVGKGKGRRILAHLSAQGEARKARILKELAEAGLLPRLEILAHALPSQETALRIEAAVIDLLGLDELSNEVTGWKSIQLGRMPLQQLVFYYAAKPVKIVDPVLLIRINRLYRHTMTDAELYDAARSAWKLGRRRESAKYVLAVFEGVVREVFEIQQWHRGGSTPDVSGIHGKRGPMGLGRWEFSGRVAVKEVRDRYRGGSVAKYFPKGLQNPVTYVNC